MQRTAWPSDNARRLLTLGIVLAAFLTPEPSPVRAETPDDVALARDLMIPMRDGVKLAADVYRGCGIGYCGACTVHIDGAATRSCLTPMSRVAGRAVTTIEGLARGGPLHPVQQAWIDEDVPQCGYCQAGQIMAAVDLLARKPQPSDADLATLTNLCRCGTYPRIRKAIRRAAAQLQGEHR